MGARFFVEGEARDVSIEVVRRVVWGIVRRKGGGSIGVCWVRSWWIGGCHFCDCMGWCAGVKRCELDVELMSGRCSEGRLRNVMFGRLMLSSFADKSSLALCGRKYLVLCIPCN